MPDVLTKEQRRRAMQGNVSSGTKPEQRVYDELMDLGLNFDVQDCALPGKPDFVFRRERIVVFVEGCFWHGCPKHYREPKSNRAFWKDKVTKNKKRDRKNCRKLRALGFGIIRIWECATRKKTIGPALERVAEMVRSAR